LQSCTFLHISLFIKKIQGSANGLGKAIAIQLARENCNLCIVDINQSEAEITAKELTEKFNVKAKAYKVDVSDYEAIEKLREDIIKDFNQTVDILVNNAGILSAISLFEGHHDQVKKVIDVNFTQHFWVSAALFYFGNRT
jgi:NAD(P)-dependent dehydrogenase (short-subunit alcohol dehydrogenase family)